MEHRRLGNSGLYVSEIVYAGLSPAQLAIAWTLHRGGVSAAIIGASRPEQVTENAVASGARLDDELVQRIDDELGDLVDRDPAKTAQMMAVSPRWLGSERTND
jgi:aryl-alcohol dehydrogenase-like predicted oxidoreductase